MLPTFRVVVCGSRSFTDYATLEKVLDNLLSKKVTTHAVVILSGMARGADSLAILYANKKGITMELHPALWDKHGKQAGYIRNQEMIQNADAMVAFWDGKSKGTADTIGRAKANGIMYYVYEY